MSETEGATAANLVRFKLNGTEIEAPAGTTVIQAAHERGVDVPFFCYHPGLKPEGNCRMCLVDVSNSRKPVPACMTLVSPGLEVTTHSEGAKAARADVLEFMLANHPLDCPICDKSGECLLQDNSYDHGKDRSRMVEKKEIKHTKELGKDIRIWGNRCIACTRCVRFCDDVAGTGELSLVNRGDRSVIDVFPQYPLQNNLSGNVVDLCPVGALIAEDFLYQARVWYEKKTDSVCHSCSRGCNIEIQTLHNQVKRIVPRHNAEVNDYWMCDHGRFDYEYVLGPKRQVRYRVDGNAQPKGVGQRLAASLRTHVDQHGAGSIAIIGSAWMSLESAFALRLLAEALGVPRENIAARARPDGVEETFKAGFRISSDKNPNRAGVARVLGDDAMDRLAGVESALQSGGIKAAILVHDLPHTELPAELAEAFGRLDLPVCFLLESDTRLGENVRVLPATAFSERTGSLVNDDGRVQLVRAATQLPRGIRPEHEVLEEILVALGARARVTNAATLFAELAQESDDWRGWTHETLGSLGAPGTSEKSR